VEKRARRHFLVVVFCALTFCSSAFAQSGTFIRVNQVGYLPTDAKIAIAFSRTALNGNFVLADASHRVVFRGPLKAIPQGNWGGAFPYYYELDFSRYQQPGPYYLRLEDSEISSPQFSIGPYSPYQEDLLLFMRQQRCGYNPWVDAVCHSFDGRTVDGPLPAGSYVDARGGWHAMTRRSGVELDEERLALEGRGHGLPICVFSDAGMIPRWT